MYFFNNDYSEGCTPEILAALSASNMEQTSGYGDDKYCRAAASLIQKECGRTDIDIHFMVGGTQTNLTIISAALRSFQGVYGTIQSHINTHEAGAIERTGHKVFDLPTKDGKITAEMVRKEQEIYLNDPSREHIVQPKMVYISQPSEIGSLYSKAELEELYAVCQEYKLYLFIDGARLGYGLTAPNADFTLADITNNCDVFCIGGTKCGALFGEATVIVNPLLKEDFRTIMKQTGAILAKGRLLGIQFEALFTDGLYYKICRHGVKMAMQIKAALKERGIEFWTESTTNQQFVILTYDMYESLSKHFIVAPWEHLPNNKIAVRICTGWATSPYEVEKLCQVIKEL